MIRIETKFLQRAACIRRLTRLRQTQHDFVRVRLFEDRADIRIFYTARGNSYNHTITASTATYLPRFALQYRPYKLDTRHKSILPEHKDLVWD